MSGDLIDSRGILVQTWHIFSGSTRGGGAVWRGGREHPRVEGAHNLLLGVGVNLSLYTSIIGDV